MSQSPQKFTWIVLSTKIVVSSCSQCLLVTQIQAKHIRSMYFLHTNCLHHFYVDDVRIASKNQEDLDKLLANLTSKNLIFTREGSFTDFLGIKSPQDINKVTITLTQKGLINKIKQQLEWKTAIWIGLQPQLIAWDWIQRETLWQILGTIHLSLGCCCISQQTYVLLT